MSHGLWLKNTQGQPSASLTMAFIGFLIVTLWLLISIFSKIGKIEIREFDASQAMQYLLPLLCLYGGRRYTDGRFSLETQKMQFTNSDSDGDNGSDNTPGTQSSTTVIKG